MAGISSKALNFGNPENKKKFIGQTLDDDLGLNWYQFKYRNHDPQIGRFVEIDPLADNYEYNSTYAYAENKLGKGFDLEGLELAEFNLIRDVTDVGSRKINADQLKERQEARANFQAAGVAVGVGLGLSFMYPNAASLVFASEIFGVPSPGAPTSMLSTVAAETNTVVTEVNTATQEVKAAVGEVKIVAQEGRGAANSAVRARINAGKEAHSEFAAKVNAKEGWSANVRMTDPKTGKPVIADAVSPSGHPVELKPSTVSGQAKGVKQLLQYERATGTNGRVIYYDPSDYLRRH